MIEARSRTAPTWSGSRCHPPFCAAAASSSTAATVRESSRASMARGGHSDDRHLSKFPLGAVRRWLDIAARTAPVARPDAAGLDARASTTPPALEAGRCAQAAPSTSTSRHAERRGGLEGRCGSSDAELARELSGIAERACPASIRSMRRCCSRSRRSPERKVRLQERAGLLREEPLSGGAVRHSILGTGAPRSVRSP